MIRTVPDEQPDGADEISLRLPALTDYARVARLAMTGLAARYGFTFDQVEDLRITIGEVFGLLVEPEDPEHKLRFTCRLLDDSIEIVAAREPAANLGTLPHLSRQILEAFSDDVEVSTDPAQIRLVNHVRR